MSLGDRPLSHAKQEVPGAAAKIQMSEHFVPNTDHRVGPGLQTAGQNVEVSMGSSENELN